MRRRPEAIARWNATVDAAYEAVDKHRLPDGSRVLLDHIFRLDAADEGDIAADAECPFLGQEAWVASDGRFNPAAPPTLCAAPGRLRQCQPRQPVRHLAGDAYRDLRSSYMDKPLCQGCNMRRPEGP